MDDKIAPTNLPQAPTNPPVAPTPTNIPKAPSGPFPNPVKPPLPPSTPSAFTPSRPIPTPPLPVPPKSVDSLSLPKIQPSPTPAPRPVVPNPFIFPPPVRPPASLLPPSVPSSVAPPKPSSGSFSLPTTPTTLKPPLTLPNDVALKSSIRTMQDDLANIKKGQAPIGIELQKPVVTIPSKPSVPPVALKPTIPLSPASSIHVELGKAHVVRPLGQPGSPTPPGPLPKTSTPFGVTIGGGAIPNSGGGLGKRNLYLAIIGGLVVLGIVGYFVYGRFSSTTPTPVATSATPTPTPILNGLEAIFGRANSINLSSSTEPAGTDPYLTLQNSVSQTGNPGEISFYNTGTDSGIVGFSGFLTKLGISHPTGLDTLNDPQGFLLSVTSSNVATNKKNLAMVVTISDLQGVAAIMKTWESTMPNDLKTLFGFDPKKKSSPSFLDNTYQGVAIRYLNFPDANSTVDYAVVSTPSGSNFLIIASSKNFIYSLVDILLNSQPR